MLYKIAVISLIIKSLFLALILCAVAVETSCQVFSRPNEAQALENLRRLTKDGKLPDEATVANIEASFPNTKSAALARLLRARIRFQNNDFAGAASFLEAPLIKQKTALGDYALWLRGQALARSGRNTEAITVFDQLFREFPASIRTRSAVIERAKALQATGENDRVISALLDLTQKDDAEALLVVAQTYEKAQNVNEAVNAYRRIYFHAPSSNEAKEAETALTRLASPLTPQNADESLVRADKLLNAKRFLESATAFQNAFALAPALNTPPNALKYGIALGGARRLPEATTVLNSIPLSAGEIKANAFFELAKAQANSRLWTNARTTLDELRRNFPNSSVTPKAFVQIGLIARDARNKIEETYFLQTALNSYPNAVDVAQAQFELAWLQHEAKNFALSSQMLTEHLARYADKDTTYRGRAGYWSARDSEQAGKFAEACALYEGVLARYEANWYGWLANQRFTALKNNRRCAASNNPAPNQTVAQAVANLKKVTVAKETSGEKEQERFTRGEELATGGMFDWALEELNEAAKTAANSPKVNLSLARIYQLRQDNTNALLALARSYPDYSQMKPEELSREEWTIFYPHNNWDLIQKWSRARNLDIFQVAGLIRQESVFNPRARSSANAFGLMQLLLPTARATARKYGATIPTSAEDLYNPGLNIELGTAYMRDQLDKFGRIEYLGVAYNAGPGRVSQWQASIPASEMDDWVEQIPFRETRGYVQGITRNRLQYQRLYDENGNFRANVGTRPLRGEIDTKPKEQFAQEFPDINVDMEAKAE